MTTVWPALERMTRSSGANTPSASEPTDAAEVGRSSGVWFNGYRARAEVGVFAELSWAKLAVLLLIGLFVFGPERLPGIAADAGRLLRKLRAMADGMTEDLKSELGPEFGDLDLASLHPRRFIQEHLFGPDEPPPVAPASEQAVLPAGARAPYDPEAT